MNIKTLTIDGVEYNIDIEKAKKLGLITPNLIRKVGQICQFENRLYLTSCVGVDKNQKALVCLISLNGGIRYVDAIPVENASKITPEEWDKITFERNNQFLLVDKRF
jgi:hypothetical protein